MADHASAKKRIRQTLKRTVRNRHIRSTVRSRVRAVREALLTGDEGVAKTALAEATRRIDQAVSKGVYHRRAGSRYISRLTQQVANIAEMARRSSRPPAKGKKAPKKKKG